VSSEFLIMGCGLA